jgi:hypothetical protein
MSERGYHIVRYADDFVILCRDETEAQTALREVQTWCQGRRLTLHPDKTQIGDCRQRGEGFEFLGYRFEGGRRWVRKTSRHALKDKIRAKTRRNHGNSLPAIIADLNPMLRGWFGYFKHAYRTEFPSIDGQECRVCARDTRRVDPSPPGLAQGDNLLCPGSPRSGPALRHKQRPQAALGLRTDPTRMA